MRTNNLKVIQKFLCKVNGHKTPYIVEAWETKQGVKRSFYLCRRCLDLCGEKSYV